MNAMERLINGYFDLKEQTERDLSNDIAQIMRLSTEQQHQTLLSYVREVNREDEDEDKEEEDE